MEKILVHVGNGGGVGVDAAGAGENPLEERAFAVGGKRGRDARLHDAVAVHDAPGLG